MKKHLLAASIATMLSGGAFAAVNLDNGTGSGGIYADELVITAGTALATAGTVDHQATATFGASFATGFVAYVRFDLPSGVTFTNNPTYAITDSANAGALVSVAQGGAGASFVVFAVAPSVNTENLVSTRTGTFTANGITISSKGSVSLRYRLFETLTNASNETLSLKDTSSSFLQFLPALSITPANGTATRTADVGATGGAYRRFEGGSLTELLNGFNVTHTARALVTGVASTPAALLTDTNSVSITGSFVARANGGVTLRKGGAEPAGYTATVTDGSATFTNISAVDITTAGDWLVQYTVSGSTPIVASEYSAGTVNLVGQAGFSPTDGVTGTASVIRNGTVLKAAFAENSSVSGVASAISLTNTSSIPAPFTVRCLTSGSPVVGTPGTVAANSGARFSMSNGLGCPAGVRGVELTFAVPTGTVIGSVVRQNLTTGVASFDSMVGNQ